MLKEILVQFILSRPVKFPFVSWGLANSSDEDNVPKEAEPCSKQQEHPKNPMLSQAREPIRKCTI